MTSESDEVTTSEGRLKGTGQQARARLGSLLPSACLTGLQTDDDDDDDARAEVSAGGEEMNTRDCTRGLRRKCKERVCGCARLCVPV